MFCKNVLDHSRDGNFYRLLSKAKLLTLTNLMEGREPSESDIPMPTLKWGAMTVCENSDYFLFLLLKLAENLWFTSRIKNLFCSVGNNHIQDSLVSHQHRLMMMAIGFPGRSSAAINRHAFIMSSLITSKLLLLWQLFICNYYLQH